MTEAAFQDVYPAASEIYVTTGMNIDAVEQVYGERTDWPTMRNMLLGTDAILPHCVPGSSPSWYFLSADHEYWPEHLKLLIEGKRWDPRVIQSLDVASTRVINHLFNPAVPGRQVRHGLVIGHVQSGKTANFTAVIAKAADAGYNLVIVLTGLYNDLRNQTQQRLSKELCGSVADPDGIHVLASNHRVRWKEETDGDHDFHDVNRRPDGTHVSPDPERPTIAVIKKNVSPLQKINQWVDDFDDRLLNQLNVLVIDDEADHASVNMMTGEDTTGMTGEGETSPSAINQNLRLLIKKLPRVCYVGYTATPFANVFIDPGEGDDEFGSTLYPKDFIISLPKPDGHFGLEDVFPSDPTVEQPPHVVIVPQSEADVLRAMTTDDEVSIPNREVPRAMMDALVDYLLSWAARTVRGERNFHHTMMVHTKHTLDAMTPLVRRIRAIVKDFMANLPRGYSSRGKELLRLIRTRWESEFAASGCTESWDEIRVQVMNFVLRSPPTVLEINMGSQDELDFDGHRMTGLRAIAVGGNRLSRGLTLEGLCVSFFIRPTNTHDTLMQMSRWFGFRGSHADLIRVHVTSDIAERFTGMVAVERELRDDLERYERQTELTPLDFGVRILRQKDMMPTRPGARRNVRTIDVGGGEEQSVLFTSRFHFDNFEALEHNLETLAEFIKGLDSPTPVPEHPESRLWRGVEPERIIDFLDDLSFPQQGTWQVDRILGHIAERTAATPPELTSWRFGLIGRRGDDTQAPLAHYGLPELRWVLPRRTRLANSNSVGMMPGPWDFVLDLPGSREEYQVSGGSGFSYNRMWDRRDKAHPLLLAYVLDKNSVPRRRAGSQAARPRTPLFRVGEDPCDVLALALAFPKSNLTPAERSRRREYWIRATAEPFPGLT